MNRPCKYLASGLLFMLASWPAASADDLGAVVQRFLLQKTQDLGDRVSVEVDEPRAQFADCRQPRPFMPGNGARRWGKVSVGIRCAGGGVRYLQARVSVQVRYWQSRRDLPRGAPVTRADLEARQGDLGRLPRDTVRDLAELEQSVTRRPLRAGSVLQQSLLTRPALVERQQLITVAAAGTGFEIARRGRALDAGGRGDSIRVRLDSREILNVEVTGPGAARLAP
ncbi:flagellar basal body P-ring formation chaperone FlgA [Parahaliea aestuarii]|uniref:Flagella basal body P-ring formation protein FlgA n=1 Tax=Parahaliea aestuarii TaxID=1852021 RepID=A0A5C9A3W0_9GAMM|nr:flagellar basal body P-ring formation chaperone FlgA [Parahaliea aestuarii]TXS94769.1 flagellar basal body P-ring formation protein FlgA [Parahaliea aestuarii]